MEVLLGEFVRGGSWDQFFEQSGPIKVEICSGKDEFLIRLAEQEPHTRFVGIERSLSVSAKLLSKINRSGRKNIRVVREEARSVLEECFKPDEIDQIYINFPDPWPKRRHNKRRLVSTEFTRLMVSRLKPGGIIQFASDHAGYADWTLRFFEANPDLENVFGQKQFKRSLIDYPPTIYMKKYMLEGRDFHFLRFRKKRA